MKKRNFTLPILIIAAILFFVWRYSTREALLGISTESNISPTLPSTQNIAEVSLVDEDTIIVKDSLAINQTTTAFDLLKNLTEKNNINLQTKQYDFGTFVQAVGDKESTAKKAWIYFINGQSGQVAADKYVVKEGDIIEWKYVTSEKNF
jgi:hypothetical protein